MNITNIFSAWEISNEQTYNQSELTPEKIREIIKPRINKSMLPLKINLYTYLATQFVSVILLSYNLSVFSSNTTLLVLTAVMLLSASAFFFYGLNTLYRLNKTSYIAKDLLDSLKSRLRLLRVNFEIWLWLSSVSLIILIFALNMMTDNVEGSYRINNIPLVVSIMLIVILFTYGLNKLSVYRLIREYRDYYSDLMNNALDRVAARDRWWKKYRKWIIIAVLVLFVILLLSLIKGAMLAKAGI